MWSLLSLLPCSLPVCMSFRNGWPTPVRTLPLVGVQCLRFRPTALQPPWRPGPVRFLPRAIARPQARLSAFIFHCARYTLVEKLIWDAWALPVNTGSSAYPQPTPAVSISFAQLGAHARVLGLPWHTTAHRYCPAPLPALLFPHHMVLCWALWRCPLPRVQHIGGF